MKRKTMHGSRRFRSFCWGPAPAVSHRAAPVSAFWRPVDRAWRTPLFALFRPSDDIKAQAVGALATIGLSVSDAVRILHKRVVNDQAFPLELKVPNTQT